MNSVCNHKTKISTTTLLLTLPLWAMAQLVAFSGKNSNPDDNFAFVALQHIPDGTTIYFTNREWDNVSGTFPDDGEGILRFVASGDISVGTVIEIVEPNLPGNTFTVSSSGTAAIVGSNEWSPTSADPHYAFAASNANTPTSTVTEVYAFMDTRTGIHVGTISDPGIGTNSSPSAMICDWTASQAVGIDYDLDRSQATLASLEDCTEGTYVLDSAVVLSLAPFVFDVIFKNGFD